MNTYHSQSLLLDDARQRMRHLHGVAEERRRVREIRGPRYRRRLVGRLLIALGQRLTGRPAESHQVTSAPAYAAYEEALAIAERCWNEDPTHV